MSTPEELHASIEKLSQERDKLWEEEDELFSTMNAFTPLSDEYDVAFNRWKESSHLSIAASQKLAEFREEGRRLDAKRREEEKRFRRPSGRLGSLFSIGLGPLPSGAQRIDPTPEALAKVPRVRLFAAGLALAAIAALLTLVFFIPWMRLSPASLIFFLAETAVGAKWGMVVGILGIIVLGLLAGSHIGSKNRYTGKFIDQLAMLEEQWYRMGAENWTTRQRIHSCLLFSLVHVTNIIYPIASLLVVGLVGVVFMATYLHIYKKTGNTEYATLASAKLHATYNRFAIGYLLIALGISLATQAHALFT